MKEREVWKTSLNRTNYLQLYVLHGKLEPSARPPKEAAISDPFWMYSVLGPLSNVSFLRAQGNDASK